MIESFPIPTARIQKLHFVTSARRRILTIFVFLPFFITALCLLRTIFDLNMLAKISRKQPGYSKVTKGKI